MKTSTLGVAFITLLSGALAQSIAPSPTESYGCEPHGDHWHCDGARATTTGVAATATPTDDDHDHDHDHEHDDDDDEHDDHAGGAGPSPTESVGCEPHGDHWHCDGPASLAATPTAQYTDATGTGAAGPSPTESFGCVAHGDHYHCEGLRATTTGGSAPTTTTDTGAGMKTVVPVLGVIAAIAAAM